MIWLVVGLGGALGAMGRYGLVAYLFPANVKSFPWGTLVANIIGSVLIGVCYVVIVEKTLMSIAWKPLIMTGFLGGFTTYSTFALEAFLLWQQGSITVAVIYAISSLLACLCAVSASVWLATKLIH